MKFVARLSSGLHVQSLEIPTPDDLDTDDLIKDLGEIIGKADDSHLRIQTTENPETHVLIPSRNIEYLTVEV